MDQPARNRLIASDPLKVSRPISAIRPSVPASGGRPKVAAISWPEAEPITDSTSSS